MASQSAIAQGHEVVIADQLNYNQKLYSHPEYKFVAQVPQTNGQPITLSTSTTRLCYLLQMYLLILHGLIY